MIHNPLVNENYIDDRDLYCNLENVWEGDNLLEYLTFFLILRMVDVMCRKICEHNGFLVSMVHN